MFIPRLAAVLSLGALAAGCASDPGGCVAGLACQPAANPCHLGSTVCQNGSASCADTGGIGADQLPCGNGGVCHAGACVACNPGASCRPANPCHAGTVDCSTGAALCLDTGDPLADGADCGPGRGCLAGACASCALAPCSPADGGSPPIRDLAMPPIVDLAMPPIADLAMAPDLGCRFGFGSCNGACTFLQSDTDCGGCGVQCGSGSQCAPLNGSYQCQSCAQLNMGQCGGRCVDFNTDARNCGGCGIVCPPICAKAGPECIQGQCATISINC